MVFPLTASFALPGAQGLPGRKQRHTTSESGHSPLGKAVQNFPLHTTRAGPDRSRDRTAIVGNHYKESSREIVVKVGDGAASDLSKSAFRGS